MKDRPAMASSNWQAHQRQWQRWLALLNRDKTMGCGADGKKKKIKNITRQSSNWSKRSNLSAASSVPHLPVKLEAAIHPQLDVATMTGGWRGLCNKMVLNEMTQHLPKPFVQQCVMLLPLRPRVYFLLCTQDLSTHHSCPSSSEKEKLQLQTSLRINI